MAPNWLGDAVMALPAIADVRRAAPHAVIAVGAKASIAPLFHIVAEVDEVIAVDGLVNRFDTALLLPNSFRSALTVKKAGIAERWGYRTQWRGALLTRAIVAPSGLHQAEYYQQLVHALGFPNGPIEPRLTVPAAAREDGARIARERGWNGRVPLVALAPGAAYGGAKRWPPSYFAELANTLADDGVNCVMVGTAADAAAATDVMRESLRPAPARRIGAACTTRSARPIFRRSQGCWPAAVRSSPTTREPCIWRPRLASR